MAKNEVAKVEEAKVPGLSMEMFAGVPTGFENVTAKNILIPRLTILQSNSPQVTPGTPEYDENLRPGMIYDTGLGRALGKEIIFCPVHFVTQWLEWFPRETKKGLANVYDNDAIMAQTVEDSQGKDVLPNGNYVAETAQFFGMLLKINGDNVSFMPAFIGMVSTQLKKSRKWLTMATSEEIEVNGKIFNPPFFYRTYKLGTTPESNAKGNWIGWTITPDKALPELGKGGERLYERAMALKKSIDAGEAEADKSTFEAENTGGGGGRRAQADNGQEM